MPETSPICPVCKKLLEDADKAGGAECPVCQSLLVWEAGSLREYTAEDFENDRVATAARHAALAGESCTYCATGAELWDPIRPDLPVCFECAMEVRSSDAPSPKHIM